MEKIDREYMRTYIQEHNITRPIWLTQAGFVFIPACMLALSFSTFLLNNVPVKYIRLMISLYVVCTGLGLHYRKKNRLTYEKNKGRAYYQAEIIMCLLFLTPIVWFESAILNWETVELAKAVALLCALLCAVTFLCTYFSQTVKISKGYYLKKEKVEKKYFNYVKWIPLYIIIAAFLKQIKNKRALIVMLAAVSIFIVTYCTYYATTYWLKLRYAKKYDMEDLIPAEPI